MPHRRAARFLGLRGMAMVLLGLYWILMGVGVATGAQNAPLHVGLAHLEIPANFRATIWIITGTISILAALTHRFEDKAVGGLFFMPGLRAVSYLGAWVLWLVREFSDRFDDQIPEGLENGWYTSLSYWAMMAFVLVIAMIPESYVPEFARRASETPHRAFRWCHRRLTGKE